MAKKRLLMMGKSGNWFMSSINIINVRRWSFWIHLDGSRSTSSTLPRRLAVLGKLSLRKHWAICDTVAKNGARGAMGPTKKMGAMGENSMAQPFAVVLGGLATFYPQLDVISMFTESMLINDVSHWRIHMKFQSIEDDHVIFPHHQ